MAKADISINLDAKCLRCGEKGATQCGLCLKCVGDNIVDKIEKGGRMPEIKVKISSIEKLETKTKVEDELEKGEVVGRRLVTTIKFETECNPSELTPVLYAMAAGHRVDISFSSPQLGLDMPEVRGKETAGVS